MLKNSVKTHSLYQLIYEATDNLLKSENEMLNKQICSEILRTSDGPKVAAKIINKILTKSLSSRCSQSIWYCLLLLDLAVKNTDSRFCSAILSKDFFVDLTKVLDPKYQVPEFVQEKFLYIIKEWYESLVSVSGYQNLAKFYKSQMTPTVTNESSISAQRPYPVDKSSITYFPPVFPINQPGCLEKDKILRDIEIIETNLSIFSDTLRTINPGQITAEETLFLKDLHLSLKRMQARINDVLPTMVWEDIINQLLQVNDKTNSTFERYSRLTSSMTQTNGNHTPVRESMADVYDQTYSLTIQDNSNRGVTDIYDIPSLPSYSEASSNLNRLNNAKPAQEMNLINFDDDINPSFYKTQPLPPIPADVKTDLIMESQPEPSGAESGLSSAEFDNFIDALTRRHERSPEKVPDDEYAPPLYDESVSKKASYS